VSSDDNLLMSATSWKTYEVEADKTLNVQEFQFNQEENN
jgi:hypothetical protein